MTKLQSRFLFLLVAVVLMFVCFKRNISKEFQLNNKEVLERAFVNYSKFPFPEDSEYVGSHRIESQLAYEPIQRRSSDIFIYEYMDDANQQQQSPRRISSCRFTNCFFTSNVNSIESSDVLLFTPFFLERMPPEKRANQIWVLHLMESPENTPRLVDFNGKINYTASYRWDADLVTPYGLWSPGPDIYRRRSRNYARGKTKKVAWFVSHCLTKNKRAEYAEMLSQYIQVDVFGSCGKDYIPRRERDHMLQHDYKFYLAFENSNCRDYITEKLFENAYKNDIVPIVMGATRKEYERVAPPHSFIHVDDFQSPQLLAEYLNYLIDNATAYNEYFLWKKKGHFMNTKFHCRLCALLQFPRLKVYSDIDELYHSTNVCRPPSI